LIGRRHPDALGRQAEAAVGRRMMPATAAIRALLEAQLALFAPLPEGHGLKRRIGRWRWQISCHHSLPMMAADAVLASRQSVAFSTCEVEVPRSCRTPSTARLDRECRLPTYARRRC